MALTDKASRGAKDAAEGADEQREEATESADEQREEATDAARERLEEAPDTGDATKTAGDAVQAAVDTVKDKAKDGTTSVVKLVATAARDAAAEVLAREASKGARQAAEYISQKAPELAKQKLEEQGGTGPAARAALNFGKAKLEGAGGVKAALSGAGGAVKGVVDKVTPGGGGEGSGEKSLGQTRRLPIECQIDIGVPRETVYNQWTQFEDSPEYMHRIKQVKQGDETTLTVGAKVWGFKREWEVEITDQEPNERIAWKTVGGTKNAGVVTFHELDERLTRVLVTLDWPPDGIIEKMASGLRVIKRATQADLKRFRAYMEMRDEETGAWRGRIEDSDVVSEEGEEEQDERAEDEGPEAEAAEEQPSGAAEAEEEEPEDEADEDYEEPEAEAAEDEETDEEEEPEAEEEEPEAEAEEEPEAEAEEEPEAEAEEEPEPEEEKPRRRPQQRRQRTRPRATARESARE
jgi:uncharacterized membrane protein